jgi:phosphatidylserine/phosphatidylglycerophosphate/cardiolipin synthase-like enzyme
LAAGKLLNILKFPLLLNENRNTTFLKVLVRMHRKILTANTYIGLTVAKGLTWWVTQAHEADRWVEVHVQGHPDRKWQGRD